MTASSSSSSSDGGGNTKASVSFAPSVAKDAKDVDSAASSTSPFLEALRHARVQATVIDLDHYRIHGGMAVETDYIVQVSAINNSSNQKKQDDEEPEFETFLLSKTFAAFRNMAQQLKKAADAWTIQQQHHGGAANNNEDANKIAKYCESVSHLVESQKTQYMGKVNYRYVKVLAKNRTTLINNVLQATCSNYIPTTTSGNITSIHYHKKQWDSHHLLFQKQVANIIEMFFLTDHCCCETDTVTAATAAVAVVSAAGGGGGGGGGGGNSGSGSGSGGGNTGSAHHLLGTTAVLGKIVTTVEDGVAAAAQKTKDGVVAAAQKTKELTRGTSGGSSDSSHRHHHHHRTGSNNPLGWLPFMDKDKNKESPAVVSPTSATGSGNNNSSGHQQRTQRRPSMVVPLTRKDRRSETLRAHDEHELSTHESARLLLDNESDTHPSGKKRTALKLPSSNNGPSTKSSNSSKIEKFLTICRNPLIFLCIGAVIIFLLKQASLNKVIIDADMALLVIFACYCLGLHTPRSSSSSSSIVMVDNNNNSKPRTMMLNKSNNVEDRSGRKLLRRSMAAQRRNSLSATSTGNSKGRLPSPGGATSMASTSAHDDDDDDDDCNDDDLDDPSNAGASSATTVDEIMGSPMSMFPVGAKIGSVTNCWGFSDYEDFQVRGATYLHDKQKVSSGEYLFPIRGCDLFLTDTCPENVGANAGIFGGHLRDLPTFLVNFRLPWGVFIMYYEIPAKFVPYLQMCYEPDNDNVSSPESKAQLMQALNNMTPGERCTARFLMKDQNHKNHTFKIIPYVVNGPWVVRQVVGGTPALIGNKLPISWVYQSAEITAGSNGKEKACYLEADLDIAASSAARSILSVARTYCQVLTLDLGFVVQGNTEDELPEQMLVGCRLHGIDPLTSPSYPMSAHHDNPLFDVVSGDSTDDENSGHFGRTG